MRAFHRGYSSQRVTRLHIERPQDAWPTPVREPSGPRLAQGWCGTSARDHTNSPVVWLDGIPPAPPGGLKWCPLCVGRVAEWYGTLNAFAKLLAGVAQRRRQG